MDSIGSTRDAIARELEHQGVSQRQLARLLGWTHTRVQRRMAGDEHISVSDLHLIARALGVPATRLIPADDSPAEVIA